MKIPLVSECDPNPSLLKKIILSYFGFVSAVSLSTLLKIHENRNPILLLHLCSNAFIFLYFLDVD